MNNPYYREIALKFGMSEEEFHAKRNHSPLFSKVVESLIHGADVYEILRQVIDVNDEGIRRIRKIAELYGHPGIVVKS